MAGFSVSVGSIPRRYQRVKTLMDAEGRGPARWAPHRPTVIADQAWELPDHDAQAVRHHHPVRCLSVLGGKVIDRCMRCHRHGEFIRFLNTVEHDVAAGKLIRVVLDNYATHKHLESPRRRGDAGRGCCLSIYRAIRAGRSASPQPRPPSSARRELLLQDDAASHPPRRPSLDRRSAGANKGYRAKHNARPQTVCPERIRR